MSKNICPVSDCGKPLYQNKQFCGAHFMRWYRYGDPLHRPSRQYDDKTGRRFGMLEVITREGNRWKCRCDCGAVTLVNTSDLQRGTTMSCGAHLRRDGSGYGAAHYRVKTDKGPASAHACVDCGVTARQWSYDHSDPDELHSGMGSYSLDPAHYVARCVPCHKKFDLHVKSNRPGFVI